MRFRVVAVIIVFALIVGAVVLVERRRPGLGQRERGRGAAVLPAPTALEESGEEGGRPRTIAVRPRRTDSSPRPQEASPPRLRRAPPRAPSAATPYSASPPPSSQATSSAAPSPSAPPTRDPSPSGPPDARPSSAPRLSAGPSRVTGEDQQDPAGEQANPPQATGSPGSPQLARSPVIAPPVLLAAPADYPSEATRVVLDRALLTPQLRVAAVEGRVVLALLVRADGTVAEVKIEASSGSDVLDAAALAAAAGWRFRPATRDGSPIKSWAIIPVRFVIPR